MYPMIRPIYPVNVLCLYISLLLLLLILIFTDAFLATVPASRLGNGWFPGNPFDVHHQRQILFTNNKLYVFSFYLFIRFVRVAETKKT